MLYSLQPQSWPVYRYESPRPKKCPPSSAAPRATLIPALVPHDEALVKAGYRQQLMYTTMITNEYRWQLYRVRARSINSEPVTSAGKSGAKYSNSFSIPK